MSVRWERLCAEFDGIWDFLRLQQQTPFSIYLPSAVYKRYPALSRADLKALIVVVNLGPTRPFGLAPFNAKATVESIRSALGTDIPSTVLACAGSEKVSGCDGLPTLNEICKRITEERFSIMHVVCHGAYDTDKHETFLYLRKSGQVDHTRDDGHVDRVSASDLINRLRIVTGQRGLPYLAFLCSCETAVPESGLSLGGLGQRLVRDLGMPAVIAMTEPVSIPLGQELSTTFYERLRAHGAVDLALADACAGLAGHGHVLIPTVFSRLIGRKLFDDIGPLTTGEWERGLHQLTDLVVERAPVLKEQFDTLEERLRPALEIRKSTDHLFDKSEDTRRAIDRLASDQVELNELCWDFLDNSFDHLAKSLPLAMPEYDSRCPLPGLGVFDEIDGEDFRPFFFGREKLTEEIQGLLKEHRFVAVLGGSGSGISSLVRAGLLELLRKENSNLKTILFPPGKSPLSRLETELRMTPTPDILVVDQFEELFTFCTYIEQRKTFLKKAPSAP